MTISQQDQKKNKGQAQNANGQVLDGKAAEKDGNRPAF